MRRCLAALALLLATPAVADWYSPPAGGGGFTIGQPITGACPSGNFVFSNSSAIGCSAANSAGGPITMVNVTADGYTSKSASISSASNQLTDASRDCTTADAGKVVVVAGAGLLGTIAAPVLAPTATQFTNGALAATNEFYKITYVSANDGSQETTPSSETTIATTINKTRYVNAPPPISGAVGWNIYAGNTGSGGAGTETKQNVNFSLTTNGTTAVGAVVGTNNVLHFASVPAWITAGMTITDVTTGASIPTGAVVISTTATTVTMSSFAAGAGVGGTDSITLGFVNAAGQTWLPFHRPWVEPAGGLATTGGAVPVSNTTSFAPPLKTAVASSPACSGTKFLLNDTNQSGGSLSGDQWALGTDNSATIAAATAANPNKNLIFPAGLILLDTTTIPLVQNTLSGASVQAQVADQTLTGLGTEFLLVSPTVVPFEVTNGNRITGINFFWPGNWRLSQGPVAYPPLWTDDGTNDINSFFLDHSTIVDAFDGYQQSPAHFTGAIAATTLTISAFTDGTLCVGSPINGAGVTVSTTISSLPDGRTAGCTIATGAYVVNNSQTVASEALTSGTPAIKGMFFDHLIPYVIDNFIEEQFVGQAITVSDTDFNNNAYSFVSSDTNKYLLKWSAVNSAFHIALGNGTPNGAVAAKSAGQLRMSNVAFHSMSVVWDVLGGFLDETAVSGGSAGNIGQYLITDPAGTVNNFTVQQNIQANQIVTNYDDNMGPLIDYESTTTGSRGMQFVGRMMSADSGTLLKLNSKNMVNFTVADQKMAHCLAGTTTISSGTTACTQGAIVYANDTSLDLILSNMNETTTQTGPYIEGVNAINFNQGSLTGNQFNNDYYALDYSNLAACVTALTFSGNTTQATGGATPINLGTTYGQCLTFGGGSNTFDKVQPLSQVFTSAQSNAALTALPLRSPGFTKLTIEGCGPGGAGGAGIVAANPSGGAGGGGGECHSRSFDMPTLLDATASNNVFYVNGGGGGVHSAGAAGPNGTAFTFSKNSAGCTAHGSPYNATTDLTRCIDTFGAGGGGGLATSATTSIGGAGGDQFADGAQASSTNTTGCTSSGGGAGAVGTAGISCGGGGSGGVATAAAGPAGVIQAAGLGAAGGAAGGGYNATAEAGGVSGRTGACTLNSAGGTAGNGANGGAGGNGAGAATAMLLNTVPGCGGAGGGGADGTHTAGVGQNGVSGGGGGGGGSSLTGGTAGQGGDGGAASVRIILQ